MLYRNLGYRLLRGEDLEVGALTQPVKPPANRRQAH
jgi:hypothetical protein